MRMRSRRPLRSGLIALISLLALSMTLIAGASAAGLKVGGMFTGPSAKAHYVVTIYPSCATAGCKKATSVAVQVTAGKVGHLQGKCPYAAFQLANATLKNGAFAGTGHFLDGGKDVTFTASGKFTSTTTVHGDVSGPKACGGADTFSIKLAAA